MESFRPSIGCPRDTARALRVVVWSDPSGQWRTDSIATSLELRAGCRRGGDNRRPTRRGMACGHPESLGGPQPARWRELPEENAMYPSLTSLLPTVLWIALGIGSVAVGLGRQAEPLPPPRLAAARSSGRRFPAITGSTGVSSYTASINRACSTARPGRVARGRLLGE